MGTKYEHGFYFEVCFIKKVFLILTEKDISTEGIKNIVDNIL